MLGTLDTSTVIKLMQASQAAGAETSILSLRVQQPLELMLCLFWALAGALLRSKPTYVTFSRDWSMHLPSSGLG
jgi:hypothetical protein